METSSGGKCNLFATAEDCESKALIAIASTLETLEGVKEYEDLPAGQSCLVSEGWQTREVTGRVPVAGTGYRLLTFIQVYCNL
jgi:hypothetical protein